MGYQSCPACSVGQFIKWPFVFCIHKGNLIKADPCKVFVSPYRSQTGQFVISKPDDSSFPSRTIRHLQAGRFVVSTQDDSSFPSMTIRRVQPPNAHMPLLGEFGQSSRDLCQTVIRCAQIPGRSAKFAKKWCVKFQNFEWHKNRKDSSDFNDF